MKKSVMAAALAVVFATLPMGAFSESSNSDTYRQLNLFGEVFERVRQDYVEEVSDQKLVEYAINGMLTSLDPHSSYLDAKEFEDMQVQTKGEFGGLGLEVTMENGVIKVVSPIDDTPAAKAGLQSGDIITHLDGKPVSGLTLNEAVDRMRGPVNTEIKLTIRRNDKEPFDVSLKRDVIKVDSVRSHAEGDIGYVRITSFNEQTDPGLKKAVEKLKSTLGPKMKGLVVDLRNNPGGLLDQAVAVCDDFLDKGEIVSTRGRKPEDAQRFNAQGGDITDGLPMVVLINGGSASASEIVAGALQDHHRAILLGTRTFGKGSVQTIIPLHGQGAMRLTTARYYTPSGRSIQARGIDPDIEVEPAKVEVIAQQPMTTEAELKGALTNDTAPPAPSPDQSQKNGTGDSANPVTGEAASGKTDLNQDYQLARAIDLLRGIYLYNSRAVN
jgi:carboxyl-terminal processing protease